MFALLRDTQASIANRHLQGARREGSAEDDLLGELADVNEAAHADDPSIEPAHIDTARGIHLGKGKESQVQSAAIVEIELVRLVYNGGIVRGGARIRRRHATDQALFIRQDDSRNSIFSKLPVVEVVPMTADDWKVFMDYADAQFGKGR